MTLAINKIYRGCKNTLLALKQGSNSWTALAALKTWLRFREKLKSQEKG